MELKDFKKRIDKIKTENPRFTYDLNEGVSISEVEQVEDKIGQKIPSSIQTFWTKFNGLETKNPALKILKLNEFDLDNGLIHFATFNDGSMVYFDTKELNTAGEWSIVNPESEYELTLTMSSFWSNKIWHWLTHETKIWDDKYWIK
jgi:hypothetical protein